MTGGQTKNAALTTTSAFHYQVLIGLEKCFALQDGQFIWFERDGDVSLIGGSVNKSMQVEVKNYSDPLTDHHENLWKTLKNWLAPEFNHTIYNSLVLHTTQPFGSSSTLRDWNQKNSIEREQILRDIFSTRKPEELTSDKLKPIVQLQKDVMAKDADTLKTVLSKVVLFTEADDYDSVLKKIQAYLGDIPKSNQQSYLEGLIGFVYQSADSCQWEISESAFHSKRRELTSIYCQRKFTIPPFMGYEATPEELALHEEKLFVQKILSIEYHEVIPEAVGNWIELHNSLNEELDNAPQFHTITNRYQEQLIKQFKRRYATQKRNCTNPILDSQTLYDEVIRETPPCFDVDQNPPLEYKNGLIHDAMDDEEQGLMWRVEP